MTTPANFPSFERVQNLLKDAYGFSGEITRLPGENENYQVLSSEGDRYILKLIDAANESVDFDLEHRILQHLALADLEIQLPEPVLTQNGESFVSLIVEGVGQFHVQVSGFLEGAPWCDAGTPTREQLRDLGAKLAALDLALQTIDDPGMHRSHRWDLTAASQYQDRIALVDDLPRRRIVEWMIHLYNAHARPKLPNLPHSLIHGDANDENILVEDARVIGLLDFGDCLYNPTVCELAIALAYIMLDHAEPLSIAAEVVAGYHAVRPLTVTELEVLHPLICGRLCTTVIVAAERRGIDPGHPNWFVTEERAWSLLSYLESVDPIDAIRALAAGTGLAVAENAGASIDALLVRRRQLISPSLSIAYNEPLNIVKGVGQYLYDDRARPFLDLINNVCHVGHCHPHVVQAGQAQMARLNTNTRYMYDGLTDYAQRLCETLPDALEVCFFVNSGSEANELALRLAEAHTGMKDFVVIDGAYHGHTGRLIDISPYKFMGKGGAGKPEPWVHVVPMPDGYRGIHRGYDRVIGRAYGDEVGQVIEQASAPIAAFLAESLLGCGGQIIPPDGYFERAFEHVRASGGLCIMDEVQVGFARVGTHFWAFERQGVIPDIVVMGKPIGNGHPMAAVVTTRAIADSFANGMEFFSTFGGNPVSCAIGMAVLDVIEGEGLQEHAHTLGNYFLEGLRKLMQRYEIIGDVRGIGLFLGIELVRDRETLEPAAAEAALVVERMKSRGVLLSTDGPLHNVIKIKPPMVLRQDDVDMTLRILEDELSSMKPG